jgi:glucose-1-phosphate cytidylyltransferase
MKAVILAGGFGTRISEETDAIPKPMIRIGDKPVLWHIMKLYSHYGINDFIICLGYKGYQIKEYFAHYYRHMSDVTIDLRSNTEEIHSNSAEPWRVTLVETGLSTMTGGRIKKIKRYLDGDEPFCLTYGDGLADVDIGALVDFHKAHGKLATVTAAQAVGRFGLLDMGAQGKVHGFFEKPKGDGAFVNGGFFVLSPRVLDGIAGDDTVWEKEPLEALTQAGELMAYTHRGFWHPMDTMRDKRYLEGLWDEQCAPWKQWND